MSRFPILAVAAGIMLAARGAQAAGADCPAGGINYGVIPYDSSAGFVPLYKRIGGIIGGAIGCPVNIQIGTSYTATIEAMRAHKLDAAEFGPLSYVLAHEVAKAEAVATYANRSGRPDTYTASIVTWPGSGITTLKEVVGHTFAYSDPASTSGHLFPAYALSKAGIDPDHGVKPIYAGSHTASFEALRNRKVQAGEMNSPEISSATAAGIYKATDFVTLWTSDPIPQDPITVRGSERHAARASAGCGLRRHSRPGLRPAPRFEEDERVIDAEPRLIAAEGIAVRFPTGRLALDGASIAVDSGEFVVVLGANGSGKSTLLRCIAGMIRPTAGSVSVAGREISALSGRRLAEARLALGMVFQHAHLVRRRSVLANVLTGTLGRHRDLATALGALPGAERHFALACLDEVGLRALAPQRSGTLSGGQAQRVAIARALAQRPRALLADEPVASLDPDAAEEVMRLLRRVAHEDGLAVLCVLHQPELARRYADRIVGLRDGRCAFDETPTHVGECAVAALYEAAA